MRTRARDASPRRPTGARGCATSSCAKAGTRGKLQVRIVTTEGELEAGSLAATLSEALGDSLGGVLWTRSHSLAETTAGGETELVWGEPGCPSGWVSSTC